MQYAMNCALIQAGASIEHVCHSTDGWAVSLFLILLVEIYTDVRAKNCKCCRHLRVRCRASKEGKRHTVVRNEFVRSCTVLLHIIISSKLNGRKIIYSNVEDKQGEEI